MFKDKWDGMLDFLFDIPGKVLLSFVIFGILSYLLYAFIYGALGAMVSKTEDISKSSSTITFIYVASFLIGMFCLSDCNGLLAKIASFIPFTSGNAMFIRISMGSVAAWEILVSGSASCRFLRGDRNSCGKAVPLWNASLWESAEDKECTEKAEAAVRNHA